MKEERGMKNEGGLLLRFGILYFFGIMMGSGLVLEALFTVSPLPEGSTGFCDCNNNLLASLFRLDRILPPISWYAFSYMYGIIGASAVVAGHRLLVRNHKRVRFLIWRAERIHGLSRSASAWSCVFLVLLIKATNSCFGVLAVDFISIFFLGVVNFYADPEVGLAMSRWVIHQSFVSAFLVAALNGGGWWSLPTLFALMPVVASLQAIVAHKYFPPASRRDQSSPPISLPERSSKDVTCGYTVLPECNNTSGATTAGAADTTTCTLD